MVVGAGPQMHCGSRLSQCLDWWLLRSARGVHKLVLASADSSLTDSSQLWVLSCSSGPTVRPNSI